MRTELNKLHDRVGETSVYVTHDQVEAMTLSDRVVVLDGGKLQQFARPQQLYGAPANEFVAGFIGEPPMNFFDARIEARGDDRWVVSDVFELRLPPALGGELDGRDGDEVRFGVRPEHLYDADVGGDPGAGEWFDVLVKVREPMGPHVDVTVAPVSSPDDEYADFTARVSNESDATVGERLTLGVELDDVHVFDRRSGDNLVR